MSLREISTAACWLTIVASFVLSFSTWLALGQLAGFGVLAVALPFCVDGYVVTSLTTWLMPEVSAKLARFARGNLYAIGLVGVTAQAGYHGWLVAAGQPGRVLLATAVGALPMAVATLAVHLRARVARELAMPPASSVASNSQSQPAPVAVSSTPPHLQPQLYAPLRQPAVAPQPAPSTSPAQDATPVTTAQTAAPAERAASTATAPKPERQARPRPPAEASGSGPRRSVSVDDVRPLVRAGLGRTAIAQRLDIGTGTARRLIDQVHAEGNRLAAVP